MVDFPIAEVLGYSLREESSVMDTRAPCIRGGHGGRRDELLHVDHKVLAGRVTKVQDFGSRPWILWS